MSYKQLFNFGKITITKMILGKQMFMGQKMAKQHVLKTHFGFIASSVNI